MRAVVLAILVSAASVSAQPVDDRVVELVTMGNGALIWERHGHVAICVTRDGLVSSIEQPDPNDGCFNYGIAGFANPAGMIWGFLRGTKSFWVGKDRTDDVERYEDSDRTVWVQRLPVTPAQTAAMVAKLETDIEEEHRFYAYDHFTDNCTTRIRNIIDNVTDHALSSMTEATGDKTFRDYARDGFAGMTVPLIATDLIAGRTTDRVPTYYERMFLPQYLREAVQKKWGVKAVPLYERDECRGNADPSCADHGIPTPPSGSGRLWFALAIVVLTAPVWLARRFGRLQRTGLAISILPYWILGTALTALAIISPLPYFRWNELPLVWLPIDLVTVFLSPARQQRYAKARIAMLVVIALLRVIHVLRQPLWVPLLWPLIPMVTLAVRSRRPSDREAAA
ncbi:MAG: DUF4105 domain-containing protein [Kofleriaceae bacterium]